MEAAPLDAEFIDFQVAAGFPAVARPALMTAFRAGRIAAPFVIIRQRKAVFAAEVESAFQAASDLVAAFRAS
jgi:hypothetical protein